MIGIVSYNRDEKEEFHLPGEYVDAVRISGGIPVILPISDTNPQQLINIIDGLIFSGGGDIDPNWYGGNSHPSNYNINSERDRYELALMNAVLEDGL